MCYYIAFPLNSRQNYCCLKRAFFVLSFIHFHLDFYIFLFIYKHISLSLCIIVLQIMFKFHIVTTGLWLKWHFKNAVILLFSFFCCCQNPIIHVQLLSKKSHYARLVLLILSVLEQYTHTQ